MEIQMIKYSDKLINSTLSAYRGNAEGSRAGQYEYEDGGEAKTGSDVLGAFELPSRGQNAH